MYMYQKAVRQREGSLLLPTCCVTWPFQIAVTCVNATNSSWIYQSCGMLHWCFCRMETKKKNSCSRTFSDNYFVRGQTAFLTASWQSPFFSISSWTTRTVQSSLLHLYIRLLKWRILPSFYSSLQVMFSQWGTLGGRVSGGGAICCTSSFGNFLCWRK